MNASPIEVVWTALAVLGFLVAAINTAESIGDLAAVEELRITNGRRITAWFIVATECTRVLVQSVFILLGVLAMGLPGAPENVQVPADIRKFTLVFQWGLVFVASLIVAQSIAIFLMRRLVLNLTSRDH